MSRREARRLATAEAIETAARRLILEQGFEQTSMDQVALAADVSRATLFNYYPGKAALLSALGESLEQRLVAAVTHYRTKYASPARALEQLFAHAGRVLEQTADLTRLLMLGSAGQRGFQQLLLAFQELAAAGQARGDWRDDLSPGLLGEQLYLGFLAGLLGWCGDAAADQRVQFARRAADLNRLLAAR